MKNIRSYLTYFRGTVAFGNSACRELIVRTQIGVSTTPSTTPNFRYRILNTRKYGYQLKGLGAQIDKYPTIVSGLKNLRVLKTTQSSFENFVDDEYRSLPDTQDRVFSTNITSTWQYSKHTGLNFDQTWHDVKEIIMENFAGCVVAGIPSPSVQNTIFLAQKNVLQSIKEIDTINIEMPNIHYFAFDVSKHPKLVQGGNKEVFHPVDKPSGIIYAQLKRKNITSKL